MILSIFSSALTISCHCYRFNGIYSLIDFFYCAFQTSFKMEEDRIAKLFKGRTLFITGGSGFLGKTLIEKLVRYDEH